jgi:hypothetical protein
VSHIDVGHAVVKAPLDEVFAAPVDEAAQNCVGTCRHVRPVRFVRRQARRWPTYDDETTPGKSGENSDVGEVGFVSVEEPGRIVEEADFVSDDPDLAGTKTMTWYFEPGDGGTLSSARPPTFPTASRARTMPGPSRPP